MHTSVAMDCLLTRNNYLRCLFVTIHHTSLKRITLAALISPTFQCTHIVTRYDPATHLKQSLSDQITVTAKYKTQHIYCSVTRFVAANDWV
jgi:hypothetical protein